MRPITLILIAMFIVVVIAAIVVRFVVATGPTVNGIAGPAPQPARNAIVITMASSITKWEWNDKAIELFNAASRSDPNLQVDGRPIHVEILLEPSPLNPEIRRYYRSPTQVQDTLTQKIKPVILSPANSTWLLKLQKEWRALYGGEIVSEPSPPLLSTPIVVAMWESRGRALGCWPEPGPSCTWQSIIDLANHPDGWGSLGHPGWQDLRFTYATVGESDVATLTVALLCGTGLQMALADITVSDVEPDNSCGKAIGDIEAKKPRAAPSSPVILELMEVNGPEYLDMVTTYEKEVIAFNQRTKGKVREPLIAAYPQDGTVVADHPFAILDGAPWVEPEQVKAAWIFREFLFSEEQQQALMQYGLRPADPNVPLAAPIDPSNGANPEANLVVLDVPDVLVIDQAVEVWKKVEKHADIVLVFDKSGSMKGEKITLAVNGAKTFVEVMSNEDWLMWLPFDKNLYDNTHGLNSEIGEKLLNDIGGTTAIGITSLYDAVGHAYRILEERRRTQGDTRRYGIVVLSDGQDTHSSKFTLAKLEAMMRPTENDPTGIQIHTIGIGDDADERVLPKIAAASKGKHWKPDVSLIGPIYRQIAKYF